MEKKRPSLISIIAILVIAILIVLIIVFTIKALTNGNQQNQSKNTITKDKVLNSIEGEQNCVVENDGRKINSSVELQTNKRVDDFIIESFEVSSLNNFTTITFDIYNTKNEDLEFGKYVLKIFDDSMNIVDTINDEVGIIEGLTRKTVSLKLEGDVANLFDIQVEKVISVKI